MTIDETVNEWMLNYLKSKGIEPDKLHELSEVDFRKLCVDAQIEAYFAGRRDAIKEEEP
jgi:hypothetical protein